MWLIPLVWGWFAVGTHHGRRKEVVEKLEEMDAPFRLAESSEARGTWFADEQARQIWRFSSHSDDMEDGPFYTYARSTIWTTQCCQLLDAYKAQSSPGNATDASHELAISSPRNREEIKEKYSYAHSLIPLKDTNTTDLQQPSSSPTLRPSSTPIRTGRRKLRAFLMAFVVQGIFGWSAFMIDYMTPTIGIGCRAFLCMMYTLVSTSSCLLLITASHLSQPSLSPLDQALNRLNLTPPRRAQLALFCRLAGKALATLNAVFIVMGCFLEFIGLYESCFCKSCYISLGSKGFVSFLSASDDAAIAKPWWYAGSFVAMGTVLVLCLAYFTKVHRENKVHPSNFLSGTNCTSQDSDDQLSVVEGVGVIGDIERHLG